MRVAISFTGGKDSVLATHLMDARLRNLAGWTGESDILEQHAAGGPTPLDPQGVDVQVVALVTFAPPAAAPSNGDDDDDDNERGFKAHPLRLVRAQAAALGAGIAAAAAAAAAAAPSSQPPPSPPPYLVVDIAPPSHADSYAAQLTRLRVELRLDALVTGDVLDVCDGFMARACARAGLRLITPLWSQPRERILGALCALGIRALVTCVDVGKFPTQAGLCVDPVADLLGRELTREMWQHEGGVLRRLHGVVDMCGEGGEFHTAVFEAEHLFLPRSLRVELTGHAFKGERHAHVILGRVDDVAAAAAGKDGSKGDGGGGEDDDRGVTRKTGLRERERD